MARYGAARDAEIFEAATVAIRRLAESPAPLFLREIFDDEHRESWSRTLISSLADRALVSVDRPPDKKGARHGAALYLRAPGLAAVVDDVEAIEDLLWPRGMPVASYGQTDLGLDSAVIVGRADADEPEPVNEEGTLKEQEWNSETMTPDDKLDALLKIGVALVEAVSALQTEVRSVRDTVEELRRAWQ